MICIIQGAFLIIDRKFLQKSAMLHESTYLYTKNKLMCLTMEDTVCKLKLQDLISK